jgi:selenocysteine lyase/cysteine desulfurase
MYNRRQFLGMLYRPAVAGVAAAALNVSGVRQVLAELARAEGTPEEIARDEGFWFQVQQAFTVDRSLVNLNNGGVSPSPAIVQDAMKRHLDYSNKAPVYTMWKVLEPQREGVRRRLARYFRCDPEEIALTRNTSEGMETLQFGIDLQPGDEVLTTNQDYPRMINTWLQRQKRDGIVLRQISIPTPAEDMQEIVRLFEENITPRTRVIMISHVIFLTGQIMPVKEIVRLGRKHGIPVFVDGAHSFAHFAFTAPDLDCDYYATSLHKWLCAPHGTGLLYVRKDKIRSIWPLMAAPEGMEDDIRKFEEIGTHPAANYLGIAEALTFHLGIGPKRKEARLRYLRDRWAKYLASFDRVRLHTSLRPEFSCGIATVQIDGIDSRKLAGYLWKRHRIIVTSIKHPEFEGIRVSPNVYTTLEEIDRFISAMEKVIRNGLPKSAG